MSKLPFDFNNLSDSLANANLPALIIFFKYLGQAGFIAFALYFIVTQFYRGSTEGAPILDIASEVGKYGIIIGITSFIIVGLYVLGFRSAITKIFLYMFLPAIILTAILVYIFVLPQYQ